MIDLGLDFDNPYYLLLLLVIPLVWLLSYRSLAGLGRYRRLLVIGLRSLVIILMILALAEIQLKYSSDRVSVIYLLDQSESIPSGKREFMLSYVRQEVSRHRKESREDRAGIIIFGREATIEIPPFEADVPNIGKLESELESRDATNLEAALKLAQASFAEDSAKRVVIVTDGNENLGNARAMLPLLAEAGIGVDVVPVQLGNQSEVSVEKITLPQDIRRGQPIDARVVLNNFAEDGNQAPVSGKLKVLRRIGNKEELVGDEQDVQLAPGKSVISLRHRIDQPAMYTYRAVFTPDDPEQDLILKNNEATAFTHVRGKGRVLLIEDADNLGNFDYLVDRLRAQDLEIDLMASNQLFTSLAELQAYDSVILANVPRSSGDDSNTVSSFSDQQIAMMVRNVEQMGSGLLMLGGENSFGAGGWANTELEKAMPVDFQIKNSKIQAVGALVLMMHASEMAQGNHWQKVVAREAIETLGPMDYCGLIHWDNFGGDAWLWGGAKGLLRVSGRKKMMKAQLARMSPGDMPQFEPSMRMALTGFRGVNASVKHMIIISDGDPSPPSNATIAQYKKDGIKISTVAVGTHGPAGSTPLQNIANATGGKYYVVTNPKALPKIYQREARRVARPLVKDLDNVAPTLFPGNEITEGIDGAMPPLKGIVLTTLKENPLVEVALRSPVPTEPENSTVLASWTYGLGRTAVFTSDAGHRWADAWTEWENYDKFFNQLVRWSMRPVDEDNTLNIATDVRDGKIRVVITAMDKDDELVNFLTLTGVAIHPDLSSSQFEIRQESAGRYVGYLDAKQQGSYHLTISPGPGKAPIMAGVSVPYSAEYSDRDTNLALLKALAAVQPKGGQPGQVIGDDLASSELERLLQFDTFRHNLAKAISSQDVWPFVLLVCAGIFFLDVFFRRVTVGFEWAAKAGQWLKRKWSSESETQVEASIERLRGQKAAVADAIDQRRAAARFDPQLDPDAGGRPQRELEEVVKDVASQPAAGAPAKSARPSVTPVETEGESYTERLLKAKKKAWKEDQDK